MIWKIHEQKQHRRNGAAPKAAPLCSLLLLIYLFISWIFMDIPFIFFIYFIFFLNIPYIFLVCFLIYGVKSSFGHEQMTSVGRISHASVPKLSFWGSVTMVLHGFASRSPKTLFFQSINLKIILSIWKHTK